MFFYAKSLRLFQKLWLYFPFIKLWSRSLRLCKITASSPKFHSAIFFYRQHLPHNFLGDSPILYSMISPIFIQQITQFLHSDIIWQMITVKFYCSDVIMVIFMTMLILLQWYYLVIDIVINLLQQFYYTDFHYSDKFTTEILIWLLITMIVLLQRCY